jgi:hypothetical protein
LEEFKNHNLSKKEENEFQSAKENHLCKKEFKDDIRVRDHFHITSKFRGAAHQSCNLNVRTSLKIPVFFHNGSGHDFKHFIKKLYKKDPDLKVLSHTGEKYSSIRVKVNETKIEFEFKDSLRFLLKSLDKSAEMLYKKNGLGIKNFLNVTNYFREKYPNITDEMLELIVLKGVFFYEYLDSFERMNEKNLPIL